MYRRFEDDFGWIARLDERVDGTVHGTVFTADGYPVWDKEFPDMEVAVVRLRRAFPRFEEVA